MGDHLPQAERLNVVEALGTRPLYEFFAVAETQFATIWRGTIQKRQSKGRVLPRRMNQATALVKKASSHPAFSTFKGITATGADAEGNDESKIVY